MIKTSIEKLSDSIGFDIGSSDDETQANLLNGFCRALKYSMQSDKLQMQISYMVDHLSNESMFILKEIAEFIKLRESEK